MIRIVEVLEATTGGTRRHLRDLMLGLDQESFALSVIASPLRDPDFTAVDVPAFHARGINTILIPMQRRPAPLGDTVALMRIVRELRRLRPDVLHAHSSKAGFLARLAARVVRVPRVLYSPHGFAFDMDVPVWQRRIYRALERSAARWTDVCVCVCEREREEALALGTYKPEQVVNIPNGVRLPVPTFASELADEAPVVVFVGRFCRQKGPELLAEAATAIRRLVPSVRFRFVGAGPLETDIRRLLSKLPPSCWRIDTSVDPETARTITGTADVLVMPSRWEGLPYVLLDAMAAGTAVVATAVGGIPEVLAHDINGRLVPPNDVRALTDAVAGLFTDAALRSRLGIAARETARGYALERMLHDVAAQYYASSPAATP